MTADPNKKSARTFQCRDALWETFEQFARELECSVDYLVNEAMKQYARQRTHGAIRTPYPGTRPEPSQPATAVAPPSVPAARVPPPPPARAPAMPPLPPPPPARPPAPLGRATGPTPLPARAGLPAAALGRGPSVLPPVPGTGVLPPIPSPARSISAAGPRRSMPPLPSSHSSTGPRSVARETGANGLVAPAQAAALTLVYNGERHPITKDRFVIGRGKQSSDLTLRDPNVSRQHAVVEFQNGIYFMVDMGSTNGVAYNGQRIARKPIDEGDVFRICDHDLHFTYQ